MIRFLLAEGHWEFYCNPTYHFSEYHSCLVHFQFTTSNNSLYFHKWAFQYNCMVPGVLRLIKIVLLKTTLYIFLNYYVLYLNEMFEINYLLTQQELLSGVHHSTHRKPGLLWCLDKCLKFVAFFEHFFGHFYTS